MQIREVPEDFEKDKEKIVLEEWRDYKRNIQIPEHEKDRILKHMRELYEYDYDDYER